MLFSHFHFHVLHRLLPFFALHQRWVMFIFLVQFICANKARVLLEGGNMFQDEGVLGSGHLIISHNSSLQQKGPFNFSTTAPLSMSTSPSAWTMWCNCGFWLSDFGLYRCESLVCACIVASPPPPPQSSSEALKCWRFMLSTSRGFTSPSFLSKLPASASVMRTEPRLPPPAGTEHCWKRLLGCSDQCLLYLRGRSRRGVAAKGPQNAAVFCILNLHLGRRPLTTRFARENPQFRDSFMSFRAHVCRLGCSSAHITGSCKQKKRVLIAAACAIPTV